VVFRDTDTHIDVNSQAVENQGFSSNGDVEVSPRAFPQDGVPTLDCRGIDDPPLFHGTEQCRQLDLALDYP